MPRPRRSSPRPWSASTSRSGDGGGGAVVAAGVRASESGPRFDGPLPPGPDAPSWHPGEVLPVLVLAFFTTAIATGLTGLALHGKVLAIVGGIESEVLLAAAVTFWLVVVRPGSLFRVRLFPRLRDVGWGVLAGVVIWLVGSLLVSYLVTVVVSVVTHHPVRSPRQLPSGLDLQLLVIAGVFVVLAAVAEELFFRGMLFRSLRHRMGFWASGAISSAAFGALHLIGALGTTTPTGWYVLAATMFFVGFGLAAVYEWRGNLAADIAGHATFNLISLILIGLLR